MFENQIQNFFLSVHENAFCGYRWIHWGVCNGKCAARYKYTRSITIFSGSTLQILSLLWRQVV